MPHTGVIDETLDGGRELLMRARLHVEGSLRRFSKRMNEDAIAAMYDAISSAMQRYTYPDVVDITLDVSDGEILSDDATLFKILKRSGVIDDSIDTSDFAYISQILDAALENRLESFDKTRFLKLSSNVLFQLRVLTSDEMQKLVEAISQ
ncbi:hypothetical protein EU527_13325 [Candidatus Thorarchaeota archaeon]|nr:MAG: hypothetical protein EU527_13325 [Candidatus Thorarchaeota archaeon]